MGEVFLGLAAFWLLLILIGLGPTRLLLGTRSTLGAVLVLAPILAVLPCTIAANLLYQQDLPVRVWAWPLAAAGMVVGGLAGILAHRRKPTIETSAAFPGDRAVLATLASGGLLLFLPYLVGGPQFHVLRGNATDQMNYIALANYMQDQPLSWAQQATLDELGETDLTYRFTAGFGQWRWVTKTMLAWGSCLTGVPVHRFYLSLALLSFLLAGGMTLFLGALAGLRTWTLILTGLAVMTGFWAQVVLDIQAFAHMNALPILLLIAWLLARYFHREADAGELYQPMVPLFLAGVALTLHYPELSPVLLVGVGLWGLRGILGRPPAAWRPWVAGGLALLLGVGAAVLLQPSLATYCLGQGRLVATEHIADWHRAWFPFLYRDGLVGAAGLTPLANYASLDAGPLGLVAKTLVRIVAVALVLALAAVLADWFRRGDRPPVLRVVQSLALGCLLVMVAFLALGKRWPAAKAFSFGTPFLLLSLVLLVPHLAVAPSGWGRRLPRCLTAAAGVLLLGQLLTAGARIAGAAARTDFPHYVWHVPSYRQGQRWDIRDLRDRLEPGEKVGLALGDVWEQEVLWNTLRSTHRLVSLSCSPRLDRLADLPEKTHPLDQIPKHLIVRTTFAQAGARSGAWTILARNRTFALVRRSLSASSPVVLWTRRVAGETTKVELAVLAADASLCRSPRSLLLAGAPSEQADGTCTVAVHPGVNYLRLDAVSDQPVVLQRSE